MQTSMTHSASPDNFKCNARTGDSELRDSLHDLIHERSEHVRLEASRGYPVFLSAMESSSDDDLQPWQSVEVSPSYAGQFE